MAIVQSPGTVPLASLRLAQVAAPVECGLCGEPNGRNTERCRHCGAPIGLSRRLHERKNNAKLLAILGPTESGKTCWIGLWADLLSRALHNSRFATHGAFSVAIQQQVVSCLARGWFPSLTAPDPTTWFWINGTVVRGRRQVEFGAPDMAGQAITEAVDRPGSQPLIGGVLRWSAGLVITLDAEKLTSGDRSPDFWALKALHFLIDLPSQQRPAVEKPLALVLTKIDRCEPARFDPELWLPRLAPSTFEFCRRRWNRWKMFSICVCAGVGFQRFGAQTRSFPTRVEPSGIDKPFDWLFAQLR